MYFIGRGGVGIPWKRLLLLLLLATGQDDLHWLLPGCLVGLTAWACTNVRTGKRFWDPYCVCVELKSSINHRYLKVHVKHARELKCTLMTR
jgi:hypothetical protein